MKNHFLASSLLILCLSGGLLVACSDSAGEKRDRADESTHADDTQVVVDSDEPDLDEWDVVEDLTSDGLDSDTAFDAASDNPGLDANAEDATELEQLDQTTDSGYPIDLINVDAIRDVRPLGDLGSTHNLDATNGFDRPPKRDISQDVDLDADVDVDLDLDVDGDLDADLDEGPDLPEPVPFVDYVIVISVDGLGALLFEDAVDETTLPTFYDLQTDAAWTHNARTDYAYTVTLPNHTSMLTGRPVAQVPEMPITVHHGYTANVDPAPTDTLHNSGNPALDYIASVFDVAHDNGLRTCLFASKTKFSIFTNSYDGVNGALDEVEPDYGRDKIDVVAINLSTPGLASAFISLMGSDPCDFAFVHFVDPDAVGHASGWGSDVWLQAVQNVDALIGDIANIVDTDPLLAGNTAIIVTADHGGFGTNHADSTHPNVFTIPFYVRSPGVEGGVDLYTLTTNRHDPGTGRPSYSDLNQPIRNGDAGNLALEFLGLESIPGSFMFDTGLIE